MGTDPRLNEAVCIALLGLIGVLAVLLVLRIYVPFIQTLFPVGSPGDSASHKNLKVIDTSDHFLNISNQFIKNSINSSPPSPFTPFHASFRTNKLRNSSSSISSPYEAEETLVQPSDTEMLPYQSDANSFLIDLQTRS